MAKATAKQSLKFARAQGLTVSPSLPGVEAAGQTWKKGAPLKYVAGMLTEIAEADVTGIAGIALGDATGVTGKQANYCPAMTGCVFEAEFSDLTDGLNTPTQAIVGEDFGLNKAGDGDWFIDNDEAAAELSVVISGFKDAVGTVNPVVFFHFKNSTTIFN
jgi:hypothetical protein